MIEYTPKHFLDHSSGLNQYSQDLIMKDQEILDGRNFYSEGGALLNRRGFRAIGNTFTTAINSTGSGNCVLGAVGSTVTLTYARPNSLTPAVGETINLGGSFASGNQGDHTVVTATPTVITYVDSTNTPETVALSVATTSIVEDIKTLFPYKDSDSASYLLGVGEGGTFKSMLYPPQKQFTVLEGASGSNFESGKTYRFAVTFVDYNLRESPFSEIIDITASANLDTLELTDIQVGPSNIWFKRIYRTLGDGSSFYTLSTISPAIINSATTYSDSTDDSTLGAGTERTPSTIYTGASWSSISNYHGRVHRFDTTNRTDFVMHKDYAVAMNGVDRIKWDAPKDLGLVDSSDTVTNHRYAIVNEDNYEEDNFPIGKHLSMITKASFTQSTSTLVLDNEYPIRRVTLRFAGDPTGLNLIGGGEALPFGVPTDHDNTVATLTVEAVAGNLDQWYAYKMTNLNMNNSQSEPVRSDVDEGATDPAEATAASNGKITLSSIADAPVTRVSDRTTGKTLSIANSSGSYWTVTRSAAYDVTFDDSGALPGTEVELAGFANAGNNGKFFVSSLFNVPTSTAFDIYNPNGVAETAGGAVDTAQAFADKIDRCTFRRLYRTIGNELLNDVNQVPGPHKALRRDTAPAGLDASYSSYTLQGCIFTAPVAFGAATNCYEFLDNLGDDDLEEMIYNYYDLDSDEQRTPKYVIPNNDDPPRFKFATTYAGRLITLNQNYHDHEAYEGERGAISLMVGNYDEIESSEWGNDLIVNGFDNDSSPGKGVITLKDSIIAFTERHAYRFIGLSDVDDTTIPVREIISGVSGCLDSRSIQLVNRQNGSQSVIFMGTDGLYEIPESGIAGPLGGIPVQKLKRLYDTLLTGERGRSQNNIPSAIQISENRYLCNVKQDSNSVNDLVIVYDYKDQSFWLFDGYNAEDMCQWENNITHCSGTQAYFEQNKGRLTDFFDNGTSIDAWIETRPNHMDQPHLVKKWDDLTVYQGRDNIDQIISVAAKPEFGSFGRTNIGLAETTVPSGYADRSMSTLATVQITITRQSSTTTRYTRSGGGAYNFVTEGLIVGDRIRIISTSPFVIENKGDFAVTAVAATYFEITNENSIPESAIAMVASNEMIGYYSTDDEMDGITSLFKNMVFSNTRDPYRVKMAPASARYISLRFESFIPGQQIVLGGWTMEYGFLSNRGNEGR